MLPEILVYMTEVTLLWGGTECLAHTELEQPFIAT